MLLGIIVSIIAIILLAFGALCIYKLYSKRDTDKKKSSVNSGPDSLETVGVGGKDSSDPITVNSDDPKHSATNYPYLQKRFKAIAIFVAACFSVLGAKIFSMQVMSGDKYTKQSSANATTTLKTPAPRGNIYDSNGQILVKNRSSLTVLADGDVANDHDTLSRLSVVLGLPYNIVKNRVSDQKSGAQSRRVIASDVSHKQSAYISEHLSSFSGVYIESRTVREYPYGALAAHLLGYTGSASEQELADKTEGRDIESGDIVGKSGIESSYDNVLSGDHGERCVVSDADGNIVSVKSEISPVKGSDVYLTIQAPVQYCADDALAKTIAPDGTIGSGAGSAGSVVVMDVTDGSIIALANYPTFKPSLFTNGVSQDTWALYNTPESYYPLLNRAIAGTYPAASTFKSFSGLAGLTYGYTSQNQPYVCTGSWDGFESGNIQKCWNTKGHGNLSFRSGLVQSCDVVFYEIGKCFFDNQATIGKDAMQNEIKKFNFGSLSGIDLEGEEAGRIPTAEWKAEYFKDVPTEASWLGGDVTNMAIGQGYVLVTPIQLALGYSGIATGKIMKPHLLKEVKNSGGQTVISYQPQEITKPEVSQMNLEIIKDALHGVVNENSANTPAFREAGIDAYCKTGTAEVAGKQDYSLNVAFGPYPNPRYVCAVVIEEGGGSSAATPIAAKVLASAIKNSEGSGDKTVSFVAGSSGKSVPLGKSSGSRTD